MSTLEKVRSSTHEAVRKEVQKNLVERIKSERLQHYAFAVYLSFRYKSGRSSGVYETLSGVCTGGLNSIRLDGEMECLMTWPTIKKISYLKERPWDRERVQKFLSSKEDYALHCRAFMGWLLNDSHFGNAFLTDSVEDAFFNGVEVNLTAPIYVVQPALIMMRRMYEFPHKVSAWFKLVENGVHPRGAAMLVECVREESVNAGRVLTIDGNRSGHYAFCALDMSLKDIENISSDPVVTNLSNISLEDPEDKMYSGGYHGRPSSIYLNRCPNRTDPITRFARHPKSVVINSIFEDIKIKYYESLDQAVDDLLRILRENLKTDSPVFTNVTSNEDGVETVIKPNQETNRETAVAG